MKTAASPVIRRADYQPPTFRIIETKLTVDLAFRETRIHAWHRVRRAPPPNAKLDSEATAGLPADSPADLELDLDLDTVRLGEIAVNGVPLSAAQYRVQRDQLIIFAPPQEFELSIENTIQPANNTALSGLYQSQDMLCSQCEAEGFRRITPAVDRPDNLAQYQVTLRAARRTFPVLLCNGNLLEQGALAGGRHYAIWRDPFPKPTYLFAIVAGKLACLQDRFITCNQRAVALRFFARDRDVDKCKHALASLKRAMRWDEQAYGREYDLDLFNVVAVSDFNMGAMENKSLNIFNTKYVLADPNMVTDADFEDVENVIGHEYFHNWSGNRVTCRDWFQLSLKEGFTVFREQQFSAAMGRAAVKRIEDVDALRSHQFREDAGPMAHPVRPDSYLEINNFYTATVYEKGAEVIRMLHTLLGAEKFRAGADLYFARHDGLAATTDDFVAAMEHAGGIDLQQFQNWYCQAGTPVVEVDTKYHAKRGTFTVSLRQSCPPTPQQPHKQPLVIPLRAALFDQAGRRLGMQLEPSCDAAQATPPPAADEQLLVLTKPQQTFVFTGVRRKPLLSLLRGFSAPVELRQSLSERELALLLAHEDDPFNRWEAGQKLLCKQILAGVARMQARRACAEDEDESATETDAAYTQSFAAMLDDEAADPALQARILTLPAETYLSELVTPIDPAAIFTARRQVQYQLAQALKSKLLARYHQLNQQNDGALNTQQIGIRSLRNACLGCLIALDTPEVHRLAAALLANSSCMTDAMAALSALLNSSYANRHALLDDFYQRWKEEPLVVDKWLALQACVARPETLSRVQALTQHEAFDRANPNKVYALIFGFSYANQFCFHASDGAGYQFARDWVAQLDPLNPQLSAKLAAVFNNWKKYTPQRKAHMRTMLEQIAKLPKLSRDVAEIVGKSLPEDEICATAKSKN